MVGHEAVDECVRCGLHEHTGKGPVEEVWVVGNLVIEALGTESCQGVEVDEAAWRLVDQLLELADDDFVVVAGLVEVRSHGRCVGLVSTGVISPRERNMLFGWTHLLCDPLRP